MHLLLYIGLCVTLFAQTNGLSCPPTEILFPCICDRNSNSILCYGTQQLDLKQMFNNLSQYLDGHGLEFYKFHLNNTSVKEIEDYTFQDIIFHEILFNNAINLERLQPKAFGTNTPKYLEKFEISGKSNIGSTNESTTDLLELIKSFAIVNTVIIRGTLINRIPRNAFNTSMPKLTYLYLSSNRISIIDSYAFYGLSNLGGYLDLSHNQIKNISSYALTFSSKARVDVDLENNLLTSDSFEENSLPSPAVINSMPVILRLGGNKLGTLRQNIFEPYLKANGIIDTYGITFTCDCSMAWLVLSYDKYSYQFRSREPECIDGTIKTIDKVAFNRC